MAAIVFIFGLRLQPEPQGKAHSINHFHNPHWHADCPWDTCKRAGSAVSRSGRGKREHGAAQIVVTGFDGFGSSRLSCRSQFDPCGLCRRAGFSGRAGTSAFGASPVHDSEFAALTHPPPGPHVERYNLRRRWPRPILCWMELTELRKPASASSLGRMGGCIAR